MKSDARANVMRLLRRIWCGLRRHPYGLKTNYVPPIDNWRCKNCGAAKPQAVPSVQSGWLIEQKSVGPMPVQWFDGDGFNPDSLKAIRFSRQEDAQKLLTRMLMRRAATAQAWELFRVRLGADNFTVTEHQWG